MKNTKIFLLVLFSAIVFSGCLQVETTVNLNKDGSGTIEEIFLMKNEVINMMKDFAMAFDSTQTEEFNIFNETELKEKAANYGEGVKYLSGEKIQMDNYEGFKAVYSFADINKLKINPSPEDKMEHEDTAEFEDTTFTEEAEQKMIEMFDGMKMSLNLNFMDDIDETDASFVDGSKVTLMEIDFSEIIKNKEVFKKFQGAKPETMEEFKEVVGDIEGIKIEFKEQVTIKF